MKWSPAILLLIAGAALASSPNGWKSGKEYNYKVRSRTFTALNKQSKQFSGILIEASLNVQPSGENTLRARIDKARYSSVHTKLDDWDSKIPSDKLNYETLPISLEPFEVKIKNGVVRDLVVNKDLPTWEVNVLKSIVSQLQVDAQGENAIHSRHNQRPEHKEPYALFKTMEDSVGGKCEVLYDVSPLPEHIHQSKPELAPIPELREDGDLISIVKTKNYSNCEQRVSYHFNFDRSNDWEIGSNVNGRDFFRSSMSQIVVSGNLKKFTIQSSVTVNKFIHDFQQQQFRQGMVASKMNLTLREVKDMSEPMSSPSNPQSTGNLVYSYSDPFGSASTRRPNRMNEQPNNHKHSHKHNHRNSDEHDSSQSSESDSSDSAHDNDDNNYLQPKPKLMEAPKNPLSPLFIGNKGNSVQYNNKVDAVKNAKNIAQQIGNEIQQPDSMAKERTLEKFSILSSLIRTMNSEQIAQVQRDLYEPPQSDNQVNKNNQGQSSRRNAWTAFRDAVAHAGTGPALLNVKQWIQNKQIKGHEASHIVNMVAASARTPTPEYVETFFEMATMSEIKDQNLLHEAAILSLSDLIQNAIVDKRSAHNRFPVHAFGRMFSKSNHDLHKKYLPFFEKQLEDAVNNGDSRKIQVSIMAVGNTGHPRMLSIFEPYLEGKKQISPYQRSVMVFSLARLAETDPKTARSVLYKIYANNADHYEIRTAAVYLLMKTNPPASMLQRMAEYTNYDSNKHVNSAVKSAIESLAELEDPEDRELTENAKAAQPLLTRENYGYEYSRNFLKNIRNPMTDSMYSILANYIGSDDTMIPKTTYLRVKPTYKGVKTPKVEMATAVSSVKDFMEFVQQKLRNSLNRNENDRQNQERQFSPENIAKLLSINGDDPKQVEGLILMNGLFGSHLLPFDNHTLEKIPEKVKQLVEEMKRGKDLEQTMLSSYEISVSFPTETGFPLFFSYKTPTFMSLSGHASLKTEEDSNQSKWPKSGTIFGKLKVAFGTETQKKMGFVAPFEHQEYIAGVDSDVHIYLPVQSELSYDRNNGEARVKIQRNEDDQEFKVFQHSVNPYTTKHDIFSLEPIKKDKNVHIINKDRAIDSQMEMNDKNGQQRMQFSWEKQSMNPEEERQNERKMENAMRAFNKLGESLLSLRTHNPSNVEYQKYSVKLSPSNAESVEFRVSYDSMRTESQNNGQHSNDWTPNAKAPHLERSLNERERKQKLLREASKNINSAKAGAVDVSLRLNDDRSSVLDITAAVGMSDVDQKSRALLFASTNIIGDQDYHVAAGFEGKNPNVETLDYEETLKANTRRKYDLVFHHGKGSDQSNESGDNKVKIQGELKQSEERKRRIRQSPEAQKCSNENSQTGNKMTQACQKANERASYPDSGEFEITFENEPYLQKLANIGLESLSDMASKYVEKLQTHKDHSDAEQDNKIRIRFRMQPDNKHVEVDVKTRNGKVQHSMEVEDEDDTSMSTKKDQNNKSRMETESGLVKNSVCSLDKTHVKTFDNHHYSLHLGQCWHVAMTTYPKNNPDLPGAQEQIPKNMRVSILAKENENGEKQLKITLGEKELKLSSSGPRQIHAKVDDKKLEFSETHSHQERHNGEVEFEIFELPDKSVKLVSDKYNVKISYDGVRAQVEAGDRYRNSVRGLCGNNNGEPEDDQKAPQGNLLPQSDDFTGSYALTNEESCQGPARKNSENAKNAPKVFQTVKPGNVISDEEAGRSSPSRSKNGRDDDDDDDDDRCMSHRTKVMKTENEICFSLRPVPTCSSRCSADSMKPKNVQYHCVDRTSASEKVAQRVENGANPDLSQKRVSKTVSQQVPISCRLRTPEHDQKMQ